jgi:ABC-2 type transport system ATP-binding protein
MAAVDVDSLTVTYGKVIAVDDVSFQAHAGDVTCILGPNGAGKTSTIEALEGLRRPASGRLSVVGLNPRTEHWALTERMGVMLQDGGIHPAVTVRAALRHAHALYDDALDVRTLVERLGLGGLERRTYRQLSGGEQRRLALALALVGRPQVAFLDEPTSGVDPAGRQVIRQVVADLRNEGVTVLLTTHDLDEAERVADRVIIIDRGRLLAEGTVDELTRTPESESRVTFRAPPGLDRAALGAHLGADVVETAPGDYTVAAPPTPPVIAAITAWLAAHDLPLGDLRAGRRRLEDVYLRLTSDSGDGPRRRRPTRAGARDATPDDELPPRATGGSIRTESRTRAGTLGRPPSTDAGSGHPPGATTSPAGRPSTVRAGAGPGDGGEPDPAVEPVPPHSLDRDRDSDHGLPPAPSLDADTDAAPGIHPAPAAGSGTDTDADTDPDTDEGTRLDAWFGAESDDERSRRAADWWSPPWSDPAGGSGASRRSRRRP